MAKYDYAARMAAQDPCVSIRDKEGRIKPLSTLRMEIIHRVRPLASGCWTKTARALEIGRSSLYRWLEAA